MIFYVRNTTDENEMAVEVRDTRVKREGKAAIYIYSLRYADE
jgi:hypothetical protein